MPYTCAFELSTFRVQLYLLIFGLPFRKNYIDICYVLNHRDVLIRNVRWTFVCGGEGVEPPQNIDPPNFLNNNLIMSQHSKQI